MTAGNAWLAVIAVGVTSCAICLSVIAIGVTRCAICLSVIARTLQVIAVQLRKRP